MKEKNKIKQQLDYTTCCSIDILPLAKTSPILLPVANLSFSVIT